jgi:hypothetical protein
MITTGSVLGSPAGGSVKVQVVPAAVPALTIPGAPLKRDEDDRFCTDDLQCFCVRRLCVGERHGAESRAGCLEQVGLPAVYWIGTRAADSDERCGSCGCQRQEGLPHRAHPPVSPPRRRDVLRAAPTCQGTRSRINGVVHRPLDSRRRCAPGRSSFDLAGPSTLDLQAGTAAPQRGRRLGRRARAAAASAAKTRSS